MVLECVFRSQAQNDNCWRNIATNVPTARKDGGHTVSKHKDKTKESISIAITGSGGAGVMTAGNLLLEVAAQAGLVRPDGALQRAADPRRRSGGAAALFAGAGRMPGRPLRCPDRHRLAEHPPLRRRDSARCGERDDGRSRAGRTAGGIRPARRALRAAAVQADGQGAARELAQHDRARPRRGIGRPARWTRSKPYCRNR